MDSHYAAFLNNSEWCGAIEFTVNYVRVIPCLCIRRSDILSSLVTGEDQPTACTIWEKANVLESPALLGRVGAGIGWPLFWQIRNSRFVANHGDINISGLSDSVIMDNTFHRRSLLGSFLDEPSILIDTGTDNVVVNNYYAK